MDRHSSYISIWFQLELCAMAVLLTKGEIRCYCDAPHCVATGYMCKSELGACFTRVLDPLSVNSPLTHGCVDSFTNPVDICLAKSLDVLPGGSPVLECCHEDMCNYRGLHDLGQPRGDPTDHGRSQTDNGPNRHLVTRVTELSSGKEVWFRAAVIAVPIAGGLILVLLIMLALRMLRSENRRLQAQRQQMLSRLHYSFHGHQAKKGLPAAATLAKLDLECMVPLGAGAESCCLACDKLRQAELAGVTSGGIGGGSGGGVGGERILSLVHWGVYSGHGKLEFV
ncbi:hypothetical protein AALO_G00212970 [Alosa alosa]|uniref:BMP and activin membrane-bound inhibitor homolog n=1 Tax=Alosa alosa TaxID=278164 RepID=A0AAV6G047_9TELE|nr:BMP and activin membrane-bound inhibitor (Xenopus laevis) homolog a [Alosa alosa]KAG5268473.1 hypothetical protein AALO_G00212970 [Alosa alosa]